MVPRKFQYYAPESIRGALRLLRKHRGAARILAGGQSLIPLMKLRLASPTYIISLRKITNLSYVREGSRRLRIGALTKHSTIESSSLIKQKLSMLAEAAATIGDSQIRNMGTIGGSLAHADPAGDYGPVALAAGAEMRIANLRGERTVGADKFFVDAFTTVLKPHEILLEIGFPTSGRRSEGAYEKLERKAGDFAIVSAAASITVGEHGMCRRAGLALGAVGLTPIRATAVEQQLVGKKLSKSLIETAAKRASEQCDPAGDIHSSAEYKRAMAAVLTKRALLRAMWKLGLKP